MTLGKTLLTVYTECHFSVIMPNASFAKSPSELYNAEYDFAECHYAECHFADW